MLKYIFICFTVIFYFSIFKIYAQQFNTSLIRGDFQSEIQYYFDDSIIGTPDIKEKALMNAYLNIIYSNGHFNAGFRFETYQGPLSGYDTRYKGSGIPYRFLTYTCSFMELTVGNFYEQFGSGMLLRTYEDRNLGIDNSIDGVRIKTVPFKGITLKGLWGTQRFFWNHGTGIIRAIDGEFSLNEVFSKFNESKIKILAGASFVSKYQEDIDPVYILPENVAAMGGRLKLTYNKLSLSGEYAYKYNDPSVENGFIYKPGQALLINTTYSRKGLGIILATKRTDNMSFRSDRNALGNVLNINYLPSLSKEQTYSFASMYPIATQANGEAGIQGQIFYNIKKKSKIGGKYGANVTLAYDRTNSIKIHKLPDSTFMGYESGFFDIGKDVYFEATTVEISKKFSSTFSSIFSFVNIIYNQEVLLGHTGEPDIYAKVAVADLTWRIDDKNTVKCELQHLSTKQDKGNWASALVEYSIAPKWFFSAGDQFNYGNKLKDKKIHYYSAGVGFIYDASRFMLTYGRNREGRICTGGVCRNIPAYSGFGLSIISSF